MSEKVTRILNGPFKQNCYIISNRENEALLIDPGSDSDRIIETLKSLSLTPLAILNTHAHFDHIGAVHELMQAFNIPFYLHKSDKKLLSKANLYKLVFKVKDSITVPTPTNFYSDEHSTISIGNFSVEIINTPGHTPGGVCLLIDDCLFTGDTIFAKSVGSSKFPGGNEKELLNSFKTVSLLSKKYTIYPGHGSSCLLGDVQFKWSEVLEKSLYQSN